MLSLTEKIKFDVKVENMKNMMFKHKIRYDNYISEACRILIKNGDFNEKDLLDILEYCFKEIQILDLENLSIKLYYLITIDAPDKAIVQLFYDWFNELNNNNKIKLSLSNTEHSDIILNELIKDLDKNFLKNKYLLDIGSEDCKLTFYIAEKLKMKPVSIQIDNNTYNKNISDDCNINFLYDSINLNSVYEDLLTDNPYNEDNLKDIKIGLVIYNHSIHNIGNYQNIKNSIHQSSKLLVDNGYIIFSEHNTGTIYEDIRINLQYIFYNLKISILDSSKFKDYWIKYIKFINEYTSYLMSKNELLSTCLDNNLLLVNETKLNINDYEQSDYEQSDYNESYYDESYTILYTFKKQK